MGLARTLQSANSTETPPLLGSLPQMPDQLSYMTGSVTG